MSILQHWPFNTWKHKQEKKPTASLISCNQRRALTGLNCPLTLRKPQPVPARILNWNCREGWCCVYALIMFFSRITSAGLAGPQTMLAIILRSNGMDKMDFDSLGRWLREMGFMAVNVNEMETPRGILPVGMCSLVRTLLPVAMIQGWCLCVCLLGRSIP